MIDSPRDPARRSGSDVAPAGRSEAKRRAMLPRGSVPGSVVSLRGPIIPSIGAATTGAGSFRVAGAKGWDATRNDATGPGPTPATPHRWHGPTSTPGLRPHSPAHGPRPPAEDLSDPYRRSTRFKVSNRPGAYT